MMDGTRRTFLGLLGAAPLAALPVAEPRTKLSYDFEGDIVIYGSYDGGLTWRRLNDANEWFE